MFIIPTKHCFIVLSLTISFTTAIAEFGYTSVVLSPRANNSSIWCITLAYQGMVRVDHQQWIEIFEPLRIRNFQCNVLVLVLFFYEQIRNLDIKDFSSFSCINFSPTFDLNVLTCILKVFRLRFFIGDHTEVEPLILSEIKCWYIERPMFLWSNNSLADVEVKTAFGTRLTNALDDWNPTEKVTSIFSIFVAFVWILSPVEPVNW